MKVFDIVVQGDHFQTRSVVADSMGEAERIFKGKHPYCTIEAICLHSDSVQIQVFKCEEQPEYSEASVRPVV